MKYYRYYDEYRIVCFSGECVVSLDVKEETSTIVCNAVDLRKNIQPLFAFCKLYSYRQLYRNLLVPTCRYQYSY
jgi:hypothetical protein